MYSLISITFCPGSVGEFFILNIRELITVTNATKCMYLSTIYPTVGAYDMDDEDDDFYHMGDHDYFEEFYM